jgi:hypothetical protein
VVETREVEVVKLELVTIVSPEPKPARHTTTVPPQGVSVLVTARACPGNPERSWELMKMLGVTENDTVTVLTWSVTLMVFAPPGRIGTRVVTWKLPVAVVVRQLSTTRLSIADSPIVGSELVPLPEVAHDPVVSQSIGVVLVPTRDVIDIGLAPANPVPVMTIDEYTVPEVVEVRTPVDDSVDRDTVGPAACTGEAGSRKTIPAIPARNSSPIVPKEASLFVGVICVCILFTYFRNFGLPNYNI